MKKIASIIFGLCIILTSAACQARQQEAPAAPPTDAIVDNSETANNMPSDEEAGGTHSRETNIQIAFAADELPYQFESFHEFIHVEEAVYMIIWTDTPVTDFDFIWISNSFDLADWDVEEDTELFFFVEEIIYSVGELTPEMPFKLRTWGDWGPLPRIGVSFVDTNGITRYFSIQQSMMDSLLRITEFESTADELLYW